MNRRFALILNVAMGPLCLLASAGGPSLSGPAATEYLKEKGLYNSLGEAVAVAMYGAHPDKLGYAAPNPRQDFVARFSKAGLEIDGRGWQSSWRLRSVGYGERQVAVAPARIEAAVTRVELRRGAAVTEWYVNGARGLEQGFTLQRPLLKRQEGDRLRLTMQVSGDLKAREAGEGIELVADDGTVALRYEHLAVTDVKGRRLAARMRVVDSSLWVEVEDAGAVWPVTVDPTFAQQAYLKASNTDLGDIFGHSVAVSGDTVVVGAYGESSNATGVNGNQSDNSAGHSGAAYVFVRTGSSWSQQAYLKASNTGGLFGYSVAVSGDTVVVGAYGESSNATGVNGNQSDISAADAGAAYVFGRTGSTWSQQAYLKASNAGAGDRFGNSVAVSGDTVVVGAPFESSNATGVNGNQSDNSASHAGAAYIFVRIGSTWSQQAYLKASNTGIEEFFGTSVAVSGDTVVAGANQERSNATGVNGNQSDKSVFSAGAAYVFVRTGSTWSQQAYLKASNTDTFDIFGHSVAVSGDTVVVGAPFESSSATGVNGNQNDNIASHAGAAYVFVRTGNSWSQQAYLKASNTDADDFFGWSVAVSGDTVVVGAYQEDSNATGVNGNQSVNFIVDPGAAYVFVRTGSTWSQQAYVKASNTGSSDLFGWSVAVSGNTVVVGASQEGSNATGVNGDQSDNSANFSGAAYVFAIQNTAPSITPTGVSQQRGTSFTTQIATVSDPEDLAANLTVTVQSSNPLNGITIGSITVNGGGVVLAGVTVSCGATNASFTIRVTDSGGLFAETTLNVTATGACTCTYTLSSNAITVPASAGLNNVGVLTQPGCPWSASSSSSFLTITGGSPGSGNGNVAFLVGINSSAARVGSLTIAGLTFTVTQGTGTNGLVLSQLVGGGTEWTTTIFIKNLSGVGEGFTLRFYDDSGLPKAMPVSGLGSVDTITGSLNARETRRYETGAFATQQVAWALLTTASGTLRLSGLAVFQHNVPSGNSVVSSEGAVDFIPQTDTKYALVYDNLNGPDTTLVLVNPAPNAVTIHAEICDEQGAVIATDSIDLPALGHVGLIVRVRFSSTANRRGSIHFSASNAFAGLGLRFNVLGTFTSFRLLTSPDIE